MPIIRIDWDNEKLTQEELAPLASAVRDIVSEVTGIEDVFVYANSAQLKINVAPIEVFVEMSRQKITNQDELISKIKSMISQWKQEHDFMIPVNLTLIPMDWKIEIGI